MPNGELELALTSRITETLRELGPGFSFVGRQVHFDVDGDDYYVDTLFFHMDQNRYVVIELKTGKFQPEYAGKLSFYVALVDDMLRREHHNETIGILICGIKNDRSVRYSLGRSTRPMAVAAYTYDKLPADEKVALTNESRGGPDRDQLASINTTTYGYDAAGNPTTLANGATLTYDAANQATQYTLGGTSTAITYDNQGNRLTGPSPATGTSTVL